MYVFVVTSKLFIMFKGTHAATIFSEVLLNAVLSKLFRVLLKLYRVILGCAIKFLSDRLF